MLRRFIMKCKFAACILILGLVACSPPQPSAEKRGLPSAKDTEKFYLWLDDFKRDALARGIKPEVIEDAFANVDGPLEEVVKYDHAQPEKTKSFLEYEQAIVSERRTEEGREQWQEHREVLDKVQATYGVPAPIILALWGIESHYGQRQGSFSVIESLATLAYDGRRSAFFREQLFDALLIMQTEHKPESELTGSWAGAMGQTQFMPSSFLSFAVDFDQDGHKDIWNSDEDALASIANYLHQKGWQPNEGWGIAVQLPAGPDWNSIRDKKTLSEWNALGVRSIDGEMLSFNAPNAHLVLPDNDPTNAFLAFPNYDVIMDWNHSTYFATSVGLLADAIGAP